MMEFSKPNISALEGEYMQQALYAGHLSDGVVCNQFEEKFKQMFGHPNAVAMNSGTSALHLALLALGVGPGDEVIVTPYTFVASVNVVLAVGATPVFADIDRKTYNIDPASVAKCVTGKTKAVIPVDIFGVPCDINCIRKVIPSTVFIIQDAIEAIGSRYGGMHVGAYADIACFGFFPNKQITTAEGGLLVTDSKELADTVRRYVQHGAIAGDDTYKQWGLNLRMTDIHAAIGMAQLERFDEITNSLKSAARRMDQVFGDFSKQESYEDDTVTPFVYVIELPEGQDKKEFIANMHAEGVPVKPYFNDLLQLPHLKEYDRGNCPVAAMVASRTVALPLRHNLYSDEIYIIAEAFRAVTGETL